MSNEITKSNIDDFLMFVKENDGRNFRQGSFMSESEKVYKSKDVEKEFSDFYNRIKQLEERVSNIEKDLVKIWQPPC